MGVSTVTHSFLTSTPQAGIFTTLERQKPSTVICIAVGVK